MTNEEEKLACRMIEAKIRREGRDSLTAWEETVYSYSRHGNGGGCPSHNAPRPRDVSEYYEPPSPN